MVLSPVVYSLPPQLTYPNTDYMQPMVHLLPRLFMYQETFAANTWDVHDFEMYVGNDEELFVETDILFGRISSVILAGDYTKCMLFGLELEHWIGQMRGEESIHLTFADSSKYWVNFGLTSKRWGSYYEPAPYLHEGRWKL